MEFSRVSGHLRETEEIKKSSAQKVPSYKIALGKRNLLVCRIGLIDSPTAITKDNIYAPPFLVKALSSARAAYIQAREGVTQFFFRPAAAASDLFDRSWQVCAQACTRRSVRARREDEPHARAQLRASPATERISRGWVRR
jgi:hypothetical protein